MDGWQDDGMQGCSAAAATTDPATQHHSASLETQEWGMWRSLHVSWGWGEQLGASPAAAESTAAAALSLTGSSGLVAGSGLLQPEAVAAMAAAAAMATCVHPMAGPSCSIPVPQLQHQSPAGSEQQRGSMHTRFSTACRGADRTLVLLPIWHRHCGWRQLRTEVAEAAAQEKPTS